MRVLLVKPPLGYPTIAGGDIAELEPLELEYLAAALMDHDVELVDLRFDTAVEPQLQRFQPDVVAVTAYSVHMYNALDILRATKAYNDRIFTVVGGHHATLLPGDFKRPEVDAIVCGEGAFTFRDLLQQLESRGPPFEVPGMWYRQGRDFVSTGSRNDIDRIDEMPMPDRRITQRHRDRYFYFWWRPAALVRASAGCAFRCAYCPIWKAAAGRCSYRTPELVAEELSTIDESFVYFADDNMFFDRARMCQLHCAIEGRNITKQYFLFSRADAVVRCRDLVEKWAAIGLRQVFLGLEAVDVEKLVPLNKRTDAQTNEEAVRILKGNGIDPLVSFMIFPDFTTDDFDRIYEYVERLGVYYCEYSVLTPAPGSDLYAAVGDQLTTRDYRLYDYMHAVLPTRLDGRDFFGQLARLYRRTYSPARVLRTRPNSPPPTTPHQLVRSLWVGLRTHRRIRNAYRGNMCGPPVGASAA
jgi:radical SAM superfamily enzyme YgiQ (UPF0313 family)